MDDVNCKLGIVVKARGKRTTSVFGRILRYNMHSQRWFSPSWYRISDKPYWQSVIGYELYLLRGVNMFMHDSGSDHSGAPRCKDNFTCVKEIKQTKQGKSLRILFVLSLRCRPASLWPVVSLKTIHIRDYTIWRIGTLFITHAFFYSHTVYYSLAHSLLFISTTPHYSHRFRNALFSSPFAIILMF